MAALRDAVVVGLNYIVVWVKLLTFVFVDHQRADLVTEVLSRRFEVGEDFFEDALARVLGVKHPLNVLHHEDGWGKLLNDPQVFGV